MKSSATTTFPGGSRECKDPNEVDPGDILLDGHWGTLGYVDPGDMLLDGHWGTEGYPHSKCHPAIRALKNNEVAVEVVIFRMLFLDGFATTIA
jgi:hypothetical protein